MVGGYGSEERGAAVAAAEQHISLLLASVSALHAAPDLEAGLRLVVERLRGVVPFDNVAVLLLDDRGRELRFAFALGYPQGVAEHWRFGLGQGIVGSVARSGEVISSPDVGRDERYLSAAPGTRSELAVPLRIQGRVIGVLDLGREQRQPFQSEDERTVRLLADTLAAAIEARRLNQNLREQARILSVVHEINRELTSILDRRRVLEKVANRIRSLVDFDVFSVLLWNEEKRHLEPWMWVRSDEPEKRLRTMELGEGISGTSAALRQVVRVPNVCLDPRYVACAQGVEMRSEMAVPLVFEDRLMGVLDLESREYDAFSSEHEQLMSTVGSSLAIALANAEMVEALKERQRRLDDDLETARKVQRQLLPKVTPWIRGLQVGVANEPAQHLGGDFYDLLPYGEGRVAIAIGDVAGKATSAALYGALTVGILREIAAHSRPSPAEMLGLLNDKLVELEINRRFVAMAFAVFDATHKSLTLASAGIPYPMLARQGRVRELEVGGVPLGQLRRSLYRQEVLELVPGDTVVFLTDGIEEALDSAGRPYGSARVVETVRALAGRCAGEFAQGVVEAVTAHTGAGERSDDRTVVVVRLGDDCG